MSYNYADRYLLTASIRRDGVSTFAPGHQWGTFPAFSAGWRLSQESWFNVPWVNELKLRGSWGQLGNSEIAGGAYPQFVSVNLWADYQVGNSVQLAPTPATNLANPGLTWETNQTSDFGFESSLFDNAVDFTATYYQRDTKNFLLSIPVPIVSGFRSAPINVGKMRNSGFEFEAGYNTRVQDAVDISLTGNLTTVKNELVSLTDGVAEYSQNGVYRTSIGQPVGYFYGYKTCGVYQSDADAQRIPDGTIGGNKPGAGDMCFQDLHGPTKTDSLTHLPILTAPDDSISTEDKVYLGKTIPDAYYGINLNATYRNLDFTAFFNGVMGVQRYNSLRQSMESMAGGNGNQLATTQNRWTTSNPSNTMPRAISGDPAGNNRFSDRWVEDGDFFRLKTVQLG
jgi:hypothetical protein